MTAEELEAAEEIGRGVPTEPGGDVVTVDSQVQLGPGQVALWLAGKREPRAERLVVPGPVQPRQVGVQRLHGQRQERGEQVLAQGLEGGMDRLDDRLPALVPVGDGEGAESFFGKTLELRSLLEEHGSPAARSAPVARPIGGGAHGEHVRFFRLHVSTLRGAAHSMSAALRPSKALRCATRSCSWTSARP